MTSDKKTARSRPGKAEFSIDDFIKEIEKAEDAQASKPLYAERMRNKRALDRADQKAAAEATPSLAGKGKDNAKANAKKASDAKGKRSAATGMTLKAPKSKANAVERPTNLDGFA
jgi:excinuclease ABC subunit B